MESERLIGKRVTYKVKDEEYNGTVIDKVLTCDNKSKGSSITGYLIRDEEGKVWSVQHWRISSVE